MSSGVHGGTWALCDFGGPKSRLLAANAAFWRIGEAPSFQLKAILPGKHALETTT